MHHIILWHLDSSNIACSKWTNYRGCGRGSLCKWTFSSAPYLKVDPICWPCSPISSNPSHGSNTQPRQSIWGPQQVQNVGGEYLHLPMHRIWMGMCKFKEARVLEEIYNTNGYLPFNTLASAIGAMTVDDYILVASRSFGILVCALRCHLTGTMGSHSKGEYSMLSSKENEDWAEYLL